MNICVKIVLKVHECNISQGHWTSDIGVQEPLRMSSALGQRVWPDPPIGSSIIPWLILSFPIEKTVWDVYPDYIPICYI